MRQRPLSPHISVYRMTRYSLLSSILNRATGILLSLGLVALVYWLTSLARGAHAYVQAQTLLASLPAKALYAALLAAFSYHLVAGLRHLVWDTGHGLERSQSQKSAWLVMVAALVLAVLLIACAFRAREGV